MVKKTFMIFCICLLTACAVVNTSSHAIEITKITNVGNDGESSEFCADFSLTKKEAQHFFDNANKTTSKNIHDNYSFLPCFVSGAGLLDGNKCEWEVRAGGTSSVMCESDSFVMACDNCLPK